MVPKEILHCFGTSTKMLYQSNLLVSMKINGKTDRFNDKKHEKLVHRRRAAAAPEPERRSRSNLTFHATRPTPQQFPSLTRKYHQGIF